MLDALAKLHAAEEPTAEEWTRVIEERARKDKLNLGFGELTWEHLCRADSFRRYRDANPTAAAKRLAAHTPSRDDDE
jgi:hypothetical protein